MADKKKTRRWVIRAIVSFLAIMLLLTFFSNTIMNATIPKVVAEYSQQGNLSSTSTAKGRIECSNKTEYKVPEELDGRKIKSINYEPYDYVGKNDLVIELEPVEDTTDLDELIDTYESMSKEMEYDARTPKEDALKAYNDSLDSAKDSVKDAQEKINKIKEQEIKSDNAQAVIDELTPSSEALAAEITAASTTVEDSNVRITEIDQDIAKIDEKIEYLKLIPTTTPSDTTDTSETSETSTTETSATEPTTTESEENKSITADLDTVEKCEAKKQELLDEKATLEAIITDAQGRVSTATEKKADVDKIIEEAKATLQEGSMSDSSLDMAEKELKNANKSVSDAEKNLSDAKVKEGINAEKDADTKVATQKKLEKTKEKIDKMQASIDLVEILAPETGNINDIIVGEGDKLQAGQVIFSIYPDYSDMVCTVEFSFPTEQTRDFAVGKELTPDTSWIDTVTIISIKPDKNDPRNTRIVKCSVEADSLYPGEEITVVASKSNQNYENIVPSSAVITDNSGSFVYALVEKNTPLGKKYTVKKIDVEIDKTDGARTAIKGEGLKRDYQYVTRSEEPLKDGDRVRLQDYSKKE